MYRNNKPKDKRGGGGSIQFSGYHPLKEVKFIGNKATGRHFLSPKCNGQAMEQMLVVGGCGMCHGYSPVDGVSDGTYDVDCFFA